MGWYSPRHAKISATDPRALAVCDRCGFVWNRYALRQQDEWLGRNIMNKGNTKVCPECYDKPQEQLRTIVLPPDPVPIQDPRPGEFVFQAGLISSSPNAGSLQLLGGTTVSVNSASGTLISNIRLNNSVATASAYTVTMSSDASMYFAVGAGVGGALIGTLVVGHPPVTAGSYSIILVANDTDGIAPLVTGSFTITVT